MIRPRRSRRIASGAAVAVAALALAALAGLASPPRAHAVANMFFGVDFVDASNGWVVGTDRQILHTTNGGRTWSTQKRVVGDTPLMDVCFYNRSLGWAVGYDRVFRTTNGGRTWLRVQAMTFSPGTEFTAVKFKTKTKGWICGGVASLPNPWGGVYATTDGGRTWALQASWTDACPVALDMANTYTGIVVGVTTRDDGSGAHLTPFSATTSDGLNWQDPVNQLSPSSYTGYANDVDWASGGHVAIAGGYDDGLGGSWPMVDWSDNWAGTFAEVTPASGPDFLRAVTLTTGHIGYAVGDNSASVYKTTDGGMTWARKACTWGKYLVNLDFVSTTTGYAVGQTSAGGLLIIKTTTGGRTWTRVR